MCLRKSVVLVLLKHQGYCTDPKEVKSACTRQRLSLLGCQHTDKLINWRTYPKEICRRSEARSWFS